MPPCLRFRPFSLLPSLPSDIAGHDSHWIGWYSQCNCACAGRGKGMLSLHGYGEGFFLFRVSCHSLNVRDVPNSFQVVGPCRGVPATTFAAALTLLNS